MINMWMEDGYFQRDTTKRGTKRGTGRPITYETGVDEQLLSWLLEARDSRILDQRGKKSMIVQTTGSEKRHLTVTLCVLHDGDVLPALVVFKGKKPLQIRAQDVFVCTQQKA